MPLIEDLLEGLAEDEIRNKLREFLCFNAVYLFRACCHSSYGLHFRNKVIQREEGTKSLKCKT